MNSVMPIMKEMISELRYIPCPSAIPMSWLTLFERQALANHSQTLQRLSERGGVSPCEMRAIIEGRSWRREDYKVSCAWLTEWVKHKERENLAIILREYVDAIERFRPLDKRDPYHLPLYIQDVDQRARTVLGM